MSYLGVYYDHFSKKAYVRDEDEGIVSFDYRPQYYIADPNGDYKTLNGDPCSMTNVYDKNNKNLFEKDVDKNLSILLDLYKETDDVPKKHKKVFVDIEIVISGAINKEFCEKAPSEITAIALYDENHKQYYVWVLDKSNYLTKSDKNNTIVIPCSNEKILLYEFLNKWKEIDPTIIVTFNGDSFDIPYLYYRIKKKLGTLEAKSMSPIGIVQEDDYDEKMPIKIGLVNSLDYIRLYKKFITKQQPSYSLDSICMNEIGKGKIKYEGTLDNLFRDNIDEYIRYNINDVTLIIELDNKKKFLDLAIMVAHLAHTPYHYVYQTSRICEGAIMTFLKRKNIVSPNKPTTDDPSLKLKFSDDFKKQESEDDEKFMGAWVMTPKSGLWGWCLDCDLESLYPAIIRNCNIGYDSYLGRVVAEDGDISWGLDDIKLKNLNDIVEIEDKNNIVKNITIKKLISFIEENNVLLTPNGVLYSSDEESAVCAVVSNWFFLRKEFKGKMIQAGKMQYHTMEKFYDIWQQAIKVCLNAIYGSLGLISFRYGDPKKILALSVTMTGRSINQLSIKVSEDKFNKELGTNIEFAIMGDTDSAFYFLEPVLLHRYPDLDMKNNDLVLEKIREIAVELPDFINNYYKDYSRLKLNRKGEQFFRTKSEVIYKKLYISKAKQYAALMVEKEGVVKDEIDYKGIDFIKSSQAPIFRDFGKGLLKDILYDGKKSTIDKKILEFRDKFKTLTLDDSAKPSGVNKDLSQYVERKPRSGDIFSKLKMGTQAHIKSCIFYNDLLKFKKLDNEYPLIQPGDKIRWTYLKSNPYNLDVLAYNPYSSPDEIKQYIEKFMDRESLFDKNLCKKLQTIYDNLNWGSVNYNKNVNKWVKYLK